MNSLLKLKSVGVGWCLGREEGGLGLWCFGERDKGAAVAEGLQRSA